MVADEIAVGPELDVEVARAVFGSFVLRPYSTDIAAAWTVVEKMLPRRSKDFVPKFDLHEDYAFNEHGYRASFGKRLGAFPPVSVFAPTASEAICRAALKAMEKR